MAISSTRNPLSGQPTNCRTIIPKKFSYCYEGCRYHIRLPNLGIKWRGWEPLENLTLKIRIFDCGTSTGLGETETLGGHKQNLVCTGTQGKGQWPHKRLSQTCLWVCRHPLLRCELAVAFFGSGALTAEVLGVEGCWHKSSWRRFLVLYLFVCLFSRLVVSDSLRPHELQHTRPSCPSPTPGVYSNSCPSSWWCHQNISSCVVPFSSCPQSLPASGSFPMSQLFAWDGQSIGVSASTSGCH